MFQLEALFTRDAQHKMQSTGVGKQWSVRVFTQLTSNIKEFSHANLLVRPV